MRAIGRSVSRSHLTDAAIELLAKRGRRQQTYSPRGPRPPDESRIERPIPKEAPVKCSSFPARHKSGWYTREIGLDHGRVATEPDRG